MGALKVKKAYMGRHSLMYLETDNVKGQEDYNFEGLS